MAPDQEACCAILCLHCSLGLYLFCFICLWKNWTNFVHCCLPIVFMLAFFNLQFLEVQRKWIMHIFILYVIVTKKHKVICEITTMLTYLLLCLYLFIIMYYVYIYYICLFICKMQIFECYWKIDSSVYLKANVLSVAELST